jgi:hypothetical protein
LVAQLIHAESTAVGDLDRAAQRGRIAVKDASQFFAGFETMLGVGAWVVFRAESGL